MPVVDRIRHQRAAPFIRQPRLRTTSPSPSVASAGEAAEASRRTFSRSPGGRPRTAQ
jgi:hypothetical protein